MEQHYISVGADRYTSELRKIPLDEAINWFSVPENCQVEKLDSVIILPAYNSSLEAYPREEASSDLISTIFIDYDNDDETPNMNAINEFKEEMKDYDYWLYETNSSMSEEKPYPKFRAIIPLDKSIKWGDTTKTAITETFKKYQDKCATWFFAPTRNKVHTLEHHEGKPFSSNVIVMKMALADLDEQIRMNNIELAKKKREAHGWTSSNSRKDYHELPLVQEYFSTMKGGRNTSAHKAACSMFARGYEDYEIKSMLSEGPLDRNEITTVFNSAKRCRK